MWPCPALKAQAGSKFQEGDDLVPFHKLTQWLTYSLIEVLERNLGWKLEGVEDMTGLPEYRNGKTSRTSSWISNSWSHLIGGLLVDLGVLTLKADHDLPKDAKSGLPRVPPSHPAIVEWRAMTVIELWVSFPSLFISLLTFWPPSFR